MKIMARDEVGGLRTLTLAEKVTARGEGDKIRAQRESFGLSRQSLGLMVGWPEELVALVEMECPNLIVSREDLERLLEKLGMSLVVQPKYSLRLSREEARPLLGDISAGYHPPLAGPKQVGVYLPFWDWARGPALPGWWKRADGTPALVITVEPHGSWWCLQFQDGEGVKRVWSSEAHTQMGWSGPYEIEVVEEASHGDQG